jgi:purine-binding chemotaxis protein CheW
VLIATIGTTLCAIPIEFVVETMRPLPVEPLGTAHDFVAGLTIIRGVPLPVVDTARLLGMGGGVSARFVVVRVGERKAALTFDNVVEVRRFAPNELRELPPLLAANAVAAIGAADAALLLVLEASRAIPDALWAQLGGPS